MRILRTFSKIYKQTSPLSSALTPVNYIIIEDFSERKNKILPVPDDN